MSTTSQVESTTEEHDAFREQRKSALFWLRKGTEDIDIVDRLEGLLPSFVRRRYRITGLYRREGLRAPSGTLDLCPVDVPKDNVVAADALHADVDKLFDFLLTKRHAVVDIVAPERPARGLVAYNGLIRYEFTLAGLPGFEGGLTVIVNGLPAGSACHITKKVTGTRVVEDVEYEMVCDDEPPGLIPAEDALEVAAGSRTGE